MAQFAFFFVFVTAFIALSYVYACTFSLGKDRRFARQSAKYFLFICMIIGIFCPLFVYQEWFDIRIHEKPISEFFLFMGLWVGHILPGLIVFGVKRGDWFGR